MRRREFLNSVGLAALGAALPNSLAAQPAGPPNILLILAEDLGPQLGCYGEPLARTPNLDRLAATGTRFAHAFTTAPVCSPSRSSLMTGMYATSINSHNHRTRNRAPLPDGIRTLTEHLRDAGYFTANIGGAEARSPGRLALGADKTDLNFRVEKLFDGRSWAERRAGQPFFAQLTLMETHRSSGWGPSKQPTRTDPAAVAVPPFYPDHPLVRHDLAKYHDAIGRMDEAVGRALRWLEQDGLADRTIVIFMGDNGQSLVRGKQFLYDGGLHVPLIIREPGPKAGRVDERLVTGNDLAPTILGFAGVPKPAHMAGQDLFAADYKEPQHIVATRDRCDVAVDRMRCVRTKRFKYIRNYLPAVPYMQINPYMERNYPVWNLLLEMKAAGTLNAVQWHFAADRKPIEELYDLRSDPYETRNLALDPAYAAIRDDMRRRLADWIRDHGDDGAVLEDPIAVFEGYFGNDDPTKAEAGKVDAALRVFGVKPAER